jgi:hypothetical protein
MTTAKIRLSANDHSVIDFGAVPDVPALQTEALQRAIDAAGENGGIVRVPRGTFASGTLRLRSRVTLKLEEGAILLGSNDIADYDGNYWGGGFITAHDLVDVAIEGPGVIDGADCADPKGEEGFRGPHCIAFFNCSGIVVRDLKVRRSANWAFNCVSCRDAVIERLSISGGHDGLDAMHCERFAFRACEFRTGDDCIAGADNREFVFEDCFFNTACNAFRFSCLDLAVRNCRFEGPAEFPHKVTGLKEMKAAFIHFSPHERKNCRGAQPQSDEWLIENCSVKDVSQLYEYDHRTLWQSGRPVRHVTFRDVTASGLKKPIWACGDIRRQFLLSLERVTLAIPKGSWVHHPFVDLRSFDCLDARGLTCIGVDESHPAISTVDGLRVDVRDLVCKPAD